jgi:hypothetical protein
MSHKMLVALLVLTLGFAGTSWAAPIYYPDIAAATVDYEQLFEDSTTDPSVALYGAPTVSGDALLFNPPSFAAVASVPWAMDATDGTFAGYVVANGATRIEELTFQERGDYTLAGVGGAGTFVQIGATFFIDIIQIDGFDLTVPIEVTEQMIFDSGPLWDLASDGGLVQPFSGSVTIDVNQAIIDAGYFGQATKVKFSLDNALFAMSDGGYAYIKKKDIDGFSITTETDVPEPATMSLLALGGIALIRRKK